MSREVALKTILDIDNPATLNLFYKEWSTLVTMVHPNLINIYDIGEFEQDGTKKPFFVMPLLPGVTLDKLIKEGSPRLSVAAVVNMMEQAARGLQAAHEMGLVHRDVKPSNVFVMDDGWVKIIDFGIARGASSQSKTTLKGTLYYLAPEQLDMKAATPLSDLFALAVVTYEALTRRRPFQGASESEVVEAIQRHTPPPISELNHEVPYAISQVVHKAMAKQPWHRFFNVKEYGEALTKALRNETLEFFDAAKIKPRLERAATSYEQGDYAFASDILSELEAEGHLDQGIALLRGQVDQAVRQIRLKQMLENARRFYDATEYPLALRKVQEALEIDPADTSALALKALIEKERREKKISEWITLARQHLENQAFRQAREALDNVLQIKPNETEALQLAAEIRRREQEVAHVREEKAKLYQSAMQAWEKGDVTSALTKLEVLIAMDRDMPESDTVRSNTYQGFYNKVHSEHNALKNSYEEARRNLSADNCEAALAICKQFLAKYPNHALFQALKFDVEERQRQRLSAVIAETDRRADGEPDLDRRLGILEDALKLYPGEPHFTRAMELVRDKRDLVSSIVSKARFFEERGQCIEALDQWQILKSIHEKQPGLAFEIERLIKRRDQQARQNSKARWVEQTDKYLEGGDYDRAMKTIQNALVEFPGEAELLELDKLVRKNQERAKQALELLNRAREHADKGAVEASLEALHQARDLDPRNTVINTVLVNTLLEQARGLIDSNPDGADAAVQEILHLDPNHVPARSLASQLADRKREDFITWCLAQARRLQTDGDIEGALAVAAQGLGSYPNEARLRQVQGTLERARQEAQRQAMPPRPPASSTEVPAAPPAETPKPPIRTPVPTPPPEPKAEPTPVAPTPPPPRKNAYLYAGVGGGAVVLLLVVASLLHSRESHKPAEVQPVVAVAPVKLKVNLQSTPQGAQISVNGSPCGTSTCQLELPPGEYRAEAQLPDYQTVSSNFTISVGQSSVPDVSLTLLPVPPLVTLSTDLTDGAVLLDRVHFAQIQGGDIEIPKLASGQHAIFVENGGFRSSLTLEVADGAPPKLVGPIQTQGMNGFVVVHSGSDAKVYSSVSGTNATLDGKPAGTVSDDGLDLHDLSPGAHELALEAPTAHANLSFTGGPSNSILASLLTNKNLSVLNIVTNEDGVEIFLNNEKYRRTTNHGRLRIYLPAKSYSVRVHKEGFAAPAAQVVELKNKQESQLTFDMSTNRGTLAVHHGIAGAEVRVDGARIGVVRTDGEFSAAYIEPGKHTVSIRHDRYKTLDSEQVFAAGKTIDLEGALHSTFGTLKIELSPPTADAHVRVRRQGETQDREVKENSLSLPEGTYTVSASAPHYQDVTLTARVTGDATITASLTLKPIEERSSVKSAPVVTAPAQSVFLLNDWLKTPGWTSDGSALTHQGGDFVLVPGNITAANIQFSATLVHGKRLEWVVGFRDPKNYYLFQIDDTNFIRSEITDGKRSKTFKTPHGAKRDVYNTFGIDLSAKVIGHGISRDGKWIVLDNFQPPGGTAAGQFGFHIPGRDQIGLSEFRLTVK
jgi:serine/threonine-protein kinase